MPLRTVASSRTMTRYPVEGGRGAKYSANASIPVLSVQTTVSGDLNELAETWRACRGREGDQEGFTPKNCRVSLWSHRVTCVTVEGKMVQST